MKFFSFCEGQHVSPQKGMITYMRKNGSQHTTNTPIIIPKVRAALRSLERDILCFSSMNWNTTPVFLLTGTVTVSVLHSMLLSSRGLDDTLITTEDLFSVTWGGFREFFLWEIEELSALSVKESSLIKMGFR